MGGIDAKVNHRDVRIDGSQSPLRERCDAGSMEWVADLDAAFLAAQLRGGARAFQLFDSHRSGRQMVAGRAALDEVGGDSKRGTRETDEPPTLTALLDVMSRTPRLSRRLHAWR
jgi:hypothetical protein